MKRNWISGFLLVAAMALCSVSWASPFDAPTFNSAYFSDFTLDHGGWYDSSGGGDMHAAIPKGKPCKVMYASLSEDNLFLLSSDLARPAVAHSVRYAHDRVTDARWRDRYIRPVAWQSHSGPGDFAPAKVPI